MPEEYVEDGEVATETRESPKQKKKRKDYLGIHKANKNTTGACMQLRMHRDNECAFMELARQIDDMDSKAPYDWANKIMIKLGESDIGKLLSVIRGTWRTKKGDGLDLYHESQKGNKRISFAPQTNPDYPGFYLKVSCAENDKDGKPLPLKQVALPISPDEAELMRLALERAYLLLLNWR